MSEPDDAASAVDDAVDDDYVPMAAYRRRAPGESVAEPTVRLAAPARELTEGMSWAVWGVVAVPFVQALINIVIMVNDFSRNALVLNGVLFLLVLGAGVVFADLDRSALARQGIEGIPSPFIAFVPVMWLYLRSRVIAREFISGRGVLGWHLLGIVLWIGSFQVISLLLRLRQAQEAAENLFG
ncbi:MAG: hypothetical protein ACOH1T_10580 [Microbacteriaceae bacterium]